MFTVQFIGPPAHVSSAEKWRQHENIQYTGCIHSALFLLSHFNSIHPTQSCRNFQDLLVQASWPLPSLLFVTPEQGNITQHPASHWIPRGTVGTAGSLLLKYHHFFSSTFIFYSLTFTTHIHFIWCPMNFVLVLLPDMVVVSLSPIFGGKEGERGCYFHSGEAPAFS